MDTQFAPAAAKRFAVTGHALTSALAVAPWLRLGPLKRKNPSGADRCKMTVLYNQGVFPLVMIRVRNSWEFL
jgi:hypothetical protein